MNRQKGSFHAFLAGLLLLTLLAPAAAYIELQTDDDRCYNDGSFSFRAWNGKPEQLYTKDVKLEVSRPTTKIVISPYGSWSREVLWFTIYDPEQKFATYTSRSGTLNESEDYRVRLSYRGCRDRVNCIEGITLDDCPGFTSQCRGSDIQVTQCFNRGNQAFITYTVAKAAYAATIRPYQELNYYFKSNYQDRYGIDRITGLRIEQKDNRTFMAIVPLRQGETISQAAMTVKACDSPAIIHKLVACDRYLPPEIVETAVNEYVETTPTPSTVIAKAKVDLRQEEEAEARQEAQVEQPAPLPSRQAPAQPTEKQSKRSRQPVLIIPLHTVIIAIVVIIGAAIIIYSYRASHKKIREEEE